MLENALNAGAYGVFQNLSAPWHSQDDSRGQIDVVEKSLRLFCLEHKPRTYARWAMWTWFANVEGGMQTRGCLSTDVLSFLLSERPGCEAFATNQCLERMRLPRITTLSGPLFRFNHLPMLTSPLTKIEVQGLSYSTCTVQNVFR